MERKFHSSLRSCRDGADKKPPFPKVLSHKKSCAFSVIRSQLPGTSRPVQRRAPQSGNRRGRLRELRTRCVTRKFLYLWIQKTFGRVFPSKARSYYEQRQLQKVFGEWKEEWWVSHREWKLCVRADCHYRYYLYNLMFQTWKMFVNEQREMRNKYLRAEAYDAKQKMRWAWKSWLIYVVVGRTKLQMQATALEFRQRSILWMWWSAWRRRLGWVRVGRALHVSAVKHRALALQLQAWSRWRGQLLNAQRDRQKMVSAKEHQEHWQKRRSLQAWLEYLQLRRTRRQQKATAERFHHVTVLWTCFCDWRRALARRESLYTRLSRVEMLAQRLALRRAFTHWKHYVLLCAEAAAQRRMADEYHRHRLLASCFGALKDNVTRSRCQQMRRNLAHQQHKVMVQRRFWNLWQSRIEQSEERERLSLLRAAWDHYRTTLLHKCIKLWLKYTQKQQHKQLLQARADGHFQQRALPAAFRAWRRLWQRHQQESVLKARATCFHREMVGKQVFAVWWQKMFQRRENRLAERMAILHAERQILQRSWAAWGQQAATRHQERRQQAAACAHHRRWRLRRTFRTWKERAQGLRKERMGAAQAAEFHSAQLLRWAWNGWREYLALRDAEQQKQLRADRHYQRALLHRLLRRWLAHQSGVRSVLQDVAARESRHARQLLRGVFWRWRENTVARAAEAERVCQAWDHYRRSLGSKVLLQWREAACLQVHYRQQEACAVEEARRVLDRGRLRTVFRRWRARSQRAAKQRVQMEAAALRQRRRLLLEAMARWKAYHLQCIRNTLLRRQGTQLLAQRLSRSCLHRWRQQLADRKQEQQGTARALWFWSFSLQAKAWHAWLLFVLERRRKKARLEQAAQAFHHQLLREGVTRLLRFAAGVRAFRQQLQAQQQVQAAHSRHRAVRRCAALWKQKALGTGREPPLPTPSRRVTFEDPPSVRTAAGDATSLETQRPPAPRGPEGGLGGLLLAAGDPQLLELSTTRSARKQPRRPDFLLEPVQSQRRPGCGPLGRQWSEKPAGPSLTRPLPAEAQAAPATSSRPPQPAALLRPPGPKLPPVASVGRELLLPPSSFLPCGAEAPVRPQGPPCLASAPRPQLLLPQDFTGPRAHPGRGCQTADPMDAGCTELKAELEGIRQQFEHYQTNQQNLRSCERQASSLRRWLALSQEEPRPEAQAAEQQVREELEQVEAQIQRLAAELQAQRQPIRACIARVQALRQALC
ncbi:protein SFI1 homolog isoform X2 [Dasypus novemcinctus]|uniref:protein SFI1 homolog isoform X2 n=1 Tax=Dasypus novemcinctus TaxID=9361 RepID=UPI0026603305|nr:protein SFI1 homolog isoform X2 [Dasypus novemcinctus]XP_058137673.1 protein SFI1 homolog isoform X2 [Dasypus novemcinctus]